MQAVQPNIVQFRAYHQRSCFVGVLCFGFAGQHLLCHQNSSVMSGIGPSFGVWGLQTTIFCWDSGFVPTIPFKA